MTYQIYYQRKNGTQGFVGRNMPGDDAPDSVERWLGENIFHTYDDVDFWVVVPTRGTPQEPLVYRHFSKPRVVAITFP